jgi:hypothetical protein
MADNLPQDSNKPIMPRRPAGFDPVARPADKRKPEKLKPLRKKDTIDAAKIEAACLTLTEEQEACLVLGVRVDRETAAIQLNMSIAEVNAIMDSAGGRRWLEKYQNQRIKKLATMSVQAMVKVGVNKAVIEQRLVTLMMMDPSETGGKMDGQVKAASLLLDKCGYGNERDPTEDMTPEELQRLVVNKAKFIEGAKPVN